MRYLANLEYESAMCGCLIVNNGIEYELSPECFTAKLNRDVWTVAKQLIARGKTADMISIKDQIPELTPSHLIAMTDAAAFGNPKFYAEKLEELRRLRFVTSMAETMIQQTQDDSVTLEEIMGDIEAKLTTEAMRETQGYQSVRQFTLSTVNGIEKAFESKGPQGIPTGYSSLDGILGGLHPEMIIIGARPSVGKTAIGLNFCYNALKKGKRVGIFSAEMPKELLMRRLYSNRGGVDGKAMQTGYMKTADMATISECAEWFYDKPLYVNDKPNIGLYELISDAKRMKRRENVDMIMIDYIGLITPPDEKIPRHEQVSRISKALKQLSRELKIPVIVLSQVSRDTESKAPTLATLRESGSIEQDADTVIFLHRKNALDAEGNAIKVEVIVAKNRNGEIGSTPLVFTGSYQRFSEIDHNNSYK